ncbi:HTH-type transcriptional regulator DmlR [Pseudoalteromonas holothuriae]|uniref:HTH-type transcriptional regulator DmlR n=1 Tax=Pseudoalteromonas holothuriae TaxID=2963714 RepID=A0A9W4R4J5_9GAMM|nr:MULTISPECIES: LysR family transcriptional regulator [unclassified Pseudoalteromonas]CAH9062102.1 HTH-type transcriptional regulator DmlR [Pseudoalteromonas sp. CIP111951]CAH9065773.1 HTH-type transcriptional regulator DmlR [Pseudoalteromonas sp. CIP111854]
MTNNKIFDGVLIFTQVIKSGGFAAAAQALGFSNSHVSKEVNKLEARLGVRLLNRTTRSIALTPEGELYYSYCLQLVNDASDAFALLTHNDNEPKGELKLSCPLGISQSYIQPVIEQYLKRYPNVKLNLDFSDKRIDVIGDGYDLVVRAAPVLEESSLICKRLFSCSTHIVASTDYIERHGRPHHPKELVNHDCICYSNLKAPERWEFIDVKGKQFIVNVREKIKSNNGNMQASMAQSGLGICRLPEFYITDALSTGELHVLFEQFPQPQVHVYAIYPSKKHLSPKVRCFIDLLSEQLIDDELNSLN